MAGRVLIVDDESSMRAMFGFLLRGEGLEVSVAHDCESALAVLAEAGQRERGGRGGKNERHGLDLVLSDILLHGPSGLDLLEQIKRVDPLLPVIMITGQPAVDTAAAAVRLGAFDYVSKPVEREALLRVVRRALEHGSLLRQEVQLRRELRAREENIRALLNATTESAMLLTRDGEVIYANRVAAQRIGRDPEEMPGLRVEEMGLGAEVEANRRARAEEAFTMGCPVYFEDERAGRVYRNSYFPVAASEGMPERLAIFAQDITRLSCLEERLRERSGPAGLIGSGPAMQQVYERIELLARVDSSVLLVGESGTGKELTATAIHEASTRAGRPLVRVNCAALSEPLIDAELFGHVRGAFTGAVRDRVGRIGVAQGGTLFLDEIGDIPPRTQQKLLRFLENKEYERVGESRTLTADVRVIAATNADLLQKVSRGEFREDLYYRLKVMVVRLPPLRERVEDIPALADHFVGQFARSFGKDISGPDESVLRVLTAHAWPGNVRELRHTLEHACVLCSSGPLTARHLPRELLSGRPALRGGVAQGAPASRKDDRGELLDALEQARWNKAQAARLLGISRGMLYKRMRELGIAP